MSLRKTAPPSPLVHPLGDNRRLVELIAEVTSQPAEKVRQRLYHEELRLGHNVDQEVRQSGIVRNEWNEALIRFYEQTDSFLYESVAWNRNPRKLAMRQWVGDFLDRCPDRPRTILTFGDGAGFDSAFLAQRGFDVTYFEVSELNCAFARRVFEHLQCPVRQIQDARELTPGEFDAVVCLDVLEHVHAPEEMVAQFATYVRPAGQLVVHAPFYLTAGRFVTHLTSNRKKYSGAIKRLYGRHGFVLEDGRLCWDPLVLEKSSAGAARPRNRWLWKTMLRGAGMVLWGGRFWSKPYTMLAGLLTPPDRRWQEGLQR
jgi:2-polyprenyl-3-methyl-5-hydroxy-6-metoxy-1,4-benzoquinol methylase